MKLNGKGMKDKLNGLKGKKKSAPKKDAAATAAAAGAEAAPKEKEPKAPFSVKKFLLSRKALALAAVVVMLVGTGTVYGNIRAQQADMGINPVNGTDTERTQVLLSGKGYSLSKSQKQQYNLEKKKEKASEDAQAALTTTSITSLSTYGTTTSLVNSLYRPLVMTNISAQTQEAGDQIEFYIYAKTYDKKAIDSKYYTVKYNGKSLAKTAKKSYVDLYGNTWTKGTKYVKMTYTFKVKYGKKNVTIKVKDKKKKTTTEATYIITGTKARASIGNVTVTLYMDDFDMDGIKIKVPSKKGDSILEILYKAFDDTGYGFTCSNNKITKISGISLSKTVIKALKAKASANGKSYKNPSSKNSISNGDIVEGAKWVMYLNSSTSAKTNKKLYKKGYSIKLKFSMGLEDITQPVTEKTYTVDVCSTDGGSATAGESSGRSNDVVSLNASPDEGYDFIKWRVLKGDGVVADSTSPDTSITIGSSDVFVQAVFEKQETDPTETTTGSEEPDN